MSSIEVITIPYGLVSQIQHARWDESPSSFIPKQSIEKATARGVTPLSQCVARTLDKQNSAPGPFGKKYREKSHQKAFRRDQQKKGALSVCFRSFVCVLPPPFVFDDTGFDSCLLKNLHGID